LRRRFILFALIVTGFSWNAALMAAPAGEPRALSAMTYLAGSLPCHQQPARSFHRNGAQYPVCARCHGLYAGALAGIIGWALIAGARRAPSTHADLTRQRALVRRALMIAAVPTALTVALAWLHVWDAPNVMRAALAVPLGAVVAAVITAVAAGDLR
jgi:uncharacterized membrane protein